MDLSSIRNFSIIAHIDHGKSTLADRILEQTGALAPREIRDQMLDEMELERERGITIKASAVRLSYRARDGRTYIFNLIDTPGHIDFNFEVAKSLRACEGALLLVDAAQGVEAQTVGNLSLAMENNITVIPVINKIDLAHADVDKVKGQIHSILGLEKADVLLTSAKLNQGITEVLEAVVEKVPPPAGDLHAPLQALIFDSTYDTYKGAIIHVRVMNGTLKPKSPVEMMSHHRRYTILEMGFLTPKPRPCEQLSAGEVGYLICNIREAKEVVNGDTLTDPENPAARPLPGYRSITPMVFAGVYPVATKDLPLLRDTLDKLKLNDASFVYESESSPSFGFGFRCGFLGLLHMEITQERIEREYDLEIIMTAPSVVYEVQTTDGAVVKIDNPMALPDPHLIREIREPTVETQLLIPKSAMGAVFDFCEKRRGEFISSQFLDTERLKVLYLFPLSEIIVDFHDQIKSLSRGFGSMDYTLKGFRAQDLVRLDIRLNGEICEPLSTIVYRPQAQDKGRQLAEKLKELIPRQMIEVAIQASIGSRIIARETVRAIRKDVTSKCYGGDITRKRKLWEKQKKGKKRMKQFGKVEIPPETFLEVLKR